MKRLLALEIATPFAVTVLFLLASAHVGFDPNDRMGQVSAVAAIEWRFALFAVPLFVLLALAARGDEQHLETVTRFVTAAFAGLASATVAAGVLITLRWTPFGLGGSGGDSGVLADWAWRVNHGHGMYSPIYPPLQIYSIAWLARLLDIPELYAIKWFQIIGVAAVGPLAYAAWRLLLRPVAALFVGVVPAIALVEAYRPYPMLVLVGFVPVVIYLLRCLRYAGEEAPIVLVRRGVLLGLSLGVMFLMYSGWFQWSGPGFVVAVAIVFPWQSWKRGLGFGTVVAVAFLLVAAPYIIDVLRSPPIKDDFVYFDTLVEPMYVAMWRGGLPGNFGGVWPPVGELGGVGLFTVLMLAGVGAAIAQGRKRTIVIALVSMLVSTWAFRMFYARSMWSTKLVQLWPRTTAELLYLLLLLATIAIYFAIRSRLKPAAVVGAIAGLMLLIGSTSSALIDKYMPVKEPADAPGHMAWLALHDLRVDVDQIVHATVTASSSLEAGWFTIDGAIDHKPWRQYSSELGHRTDHEEWLIVKLDQARTFRRVVIYPAYDGFPIELAIDGWDGFRFTPLKTMRDLAQPHAFPLTIDLEMLQWTDRIRLRATKLRTIDGGDYVFRIGEIELYQ